jgi:2-desacetyl-2-hydroxyethyl bacteriochlorophyllide A dehydrogenase
LDRVVRFVGPRRVDLAEAAPPEPGPGEVLVDTLYSGISAGTELTAYLGTNPYLNHHWDAERRLFTAGGAAAGYPLAGWGYEEVGRIVGLGPDVAEGGEGTGGPAVGDVVWGVWGHRGLGVLPERTAARQRLGPGIDPVCGVFARPGAVALNAVLDAELGVGETVAIFGQGVIGLLATRLAVLGGADVVAVDRVPGRLRVAGDLGAAHALDPDHVAIAEAVRDLTDGRGADVCIDLSGSHTALHEAVRTVGYNGRVVAAAFYQGEAAGLRLGEEFHHNRIELVCSQISGVPPRRAGRWDRDRLHRGFMRLVGAGRVDPAPLVSHVFPAADAQSAYELLAAGGAGVLQVVLDFTAAARHTAGRGDAGARGAAS